MLTPTWLAVIIVLAVLCAATSINKWIDTRVELARMKARAEEARANLCPACGTHTYERSDDDPETASLRKKPRD